MTLRFTPKLHDIKRGSPSRFPAILILSREHLLCVVVFDKTVIGVRSQVAKLWFAPPTWFPRG